MRKIYTASALAGALLLGSAAYAATGEFSNQCAWGLANHKNVATNCSVHKTIQGKTYCFSSKDAKAQFMKDPNANLAKAETFYSHKG